MRQELREGNRSIFSRSLASALSQTLERGQQAILFLNRRGAATSVQCRDCGQALRCHRCATPLTYHSARERLVCHWCNQRRRVPLSCPYCGSPRIRYLGLGTQRVVDEVERHYPGARVLRWDRDVARTGAAHQRALEAFASGQAQVLVGTQMVVKGLDIPQVTLVAVLLADIGLQVPDYRAGERAFQLLCQVAGRTGRGSLGGQAIIQTYQPDHYALQAAAEQDYPAFYRRELLHRRELGNPPFARLARLLFEHLDPVVAEREARALASSLRRTWDAQGVAGAEIIGPAPVYPPRLRGRYRWHLVVRAPDPAVLLQELRLSPAWTVDVDPVSLA